MMSRSKVHAFVWVILVSFHSSSVVGVCIFYSFSLSPQKCECSLLSEWITKSITTVRPLSVFDDVHFFCCCSVVCIVPFRFDRKFITHNINLHIKNVCTSYLLMIRCKHFIKIDHKAIKYSPINIIYIYTHRHTLKMRLKWDYGSNFMVEFKWQIEDEKILRTKNDFNIPHRFFFV